MELIKISKDKIKISLSKAELREYDLTFEELSGTEEKTRRAFRQMLICAKEETGFESDGKKAFVQIFRSGNGGCEIFVSVIHTENEIREPKAKAKMFLFSEISSLLSLCRTLKRFSGEIESNAYFDGQKYLLELFGASELEYGYAFEYGTEVRNVKAEYLSEHYSAIRIKDAVSILSTL